MTTLATKVLLMGLAGAAAAGTAVAAPADNAAPTLMVRYTSADFATDSSARAFYHRLVKAAEQACDMQLAGTRLPTRGELDCRQQVLTAAVEKIHNPRLVAASTSSSKSG
jgi:UrcA family protein